MTAAKKNQVAAEIETAVRAFELKKVIKKYPELQQLLDAAEKAARHMDVVTELCCLSARDDLYAAIAKVKGGAR